MYQVGIIFIAWLIIIIDLYLLLRNRNNPLLLVLNFFIFYFNYSICVGEYIANNVMIPKNFLHATNFGNLYIDGLFLLLTFDLIRFYFFKNKISNINIKYKSNPIIFYIIYIYLIYVLIFQVNREPSLLYEVKIKPLYEYSILFFVFLIYYSGKSSFRNIIMHLLGFCFMFQDVYYGGRITSVQLLLLFLITKYNYLLKLQYIVAFLPIAILLFSIVGVYRSNYTFDYSLISNTFEVIKTTWFVQDTAVYAFFASITQINARLYTDYSAEYSSLFAFIASIVFGSQASSLFGFSPELPRVSEIANLYHWNVGGGMIFTWYYFWTGFWGMCLCSSITFLLIKKMFKSRKDLYLLMLLIVILTLPRWYLYSPLAFWRSSFFLFPILYFFFNLLDKTIMRRIYSLQ